MVTVSLARPAKPVCSSSPWWWCSTQGPASRHTAPPQCHGIRALTESKQCYLALG